MERSPSGVHDPWTDVTTEEDLEAQRKMDREASFQQDMGKVFEPIRKFDRSFAGEEPEREKRFRFSESDYNVHRKREFPHVHHPLKSMHKKKKKKDGHKSRKKKKKHDLKFRPVLPGVEEGSEPSSSSFESDDSYEDLDLSLDETDTLPPVVPPNGAPRLSPSKEEGVGAVHLAIPDALERRDSSTVRFADETKRKDSTPSGTPSRKNSKAKDEGRRMTFLNRMFSDHGMTSPKSSDSLKSGDNDEVAAEMFHKQAYDEPEVSKMFDGDDEGYPLVSNVNKDPLFEDGNDEKVMFTLGDADDHDEDVHHSDADTEDEVAIAAADAAKFPIVHVTDATKPKTDDSGTKKKDKKKHKRKQRSKTEHFNLSDLKQRRRAGSEIFDPSLRRVPTEPDEAAMLALADLDDMKSHRFEDVRGFRRHKFPGLAGAMPKSERKLNQRKASYAYVPSKKWDHSPHEMFVELDVLRVNSHQETEWAERARWIKFEEDVEEGSNRWGKPHVAYLSFHSLLDLRKCIESGSVILDLEAYGPGNIFHCVTEQLLVSDQIDQENQGNVLRVLQLKHNHHNGDHMSFESGANLIRRASMAISGLHSPHHIVKHGTDTRASAVPTSQSVPELVDGKRRHTVQARLPHLLHVRASPKIKRSHSAVRYGTDAIAEEGDKFLTGSCELPAITIQAPDEADHQSDQSHKSTSRRRSQSRPEAFKHRVDVVRTPSVTRRRHSLAGDVIHRVSDVSSAIGRPRRNSVAWTYGFPSKSPPHQTADKLTARNLSAASFKARFGSNPSLKETMTKPRSAPRDLDFEKSSGSAKVDIDNNAVSENSNQSNYQKAPDGLRLRSSSSASGPSLASHSQTHLPRRGTFVGVTGGGVGPRHQGDIMRKIPEGAETAMVLVGEVDFLKKPVCAFVRLSEGQVLDNMAEVPVPVRFIFLLLVPEEQPEDEAMDCLEIGRSISTLMSDKMFHETCYRADHRQDILVAINQFLDDSVVLPPGDWGRKTVAPMPDFNRRKSVVRKSHVPLKEETEMLLKKAERGVQERKYDKPRKDPLSRTGRLFGGLINDVKYRYPRYLSDLKDALNFQCLAAIIFIYFAALSPAITFGGLLSEKTGGFIGISETLLGTCICGIAYALLSGQPLNIIGATGPILVFEESMYMICTAAGVNYMAIRVWIGLWVALITLVVVMFDGSAMIRYITQFTEEIFATLISFIFIFEVFKKLFKTFQKHPLIAMVDYYPDDNYSALPTPGNGSSLDNGTAQASEEMNGQPNTALMTVILCFGTYIIAAQLKAFRNGKFLGRGLRRAIGDFGIPLAILIMTALDIFVQDVYTQKLNVPDGMNPTNAEARGWFIDPVTGIQAWVPFAAIVPAFLVFILMFMESQITAIIVNKKERNLKKGSGYHLDALLLGFFAILSGLLGFPYLCGATIRSVSHTSALTVFSRTHAPGEKPKLLEVKEQRVTATLVHVLIGISILMGALLRQIPMAVLFGVFFYMGVASMAGIHMIDRCRLAFMPVKHHPDENYVRRVRTWRMNLYTGIQVLCLGVLWAIKMSPGALAFPFILLLLVPVRLFLLPRIFAEAEMDALDVAPTQQSDQDQTEDADEPDFYEQSHIT